MFNKSKEEKEIKKQEKFEQKEAKKQEKQNKQDLKMAKKQEKQDQKKMEMLEKYGLSTLSEPEDVESVNKIVNELIGTGMMEAGMKLSIGVKAEDELQVIYQRTIMEQNFIIIRQLDRICKKLDHD